MESTLSLAYKGDWPGKTWSRLDRAARVQTLRHELRVPGETCDPLRIVFASDLHLGPTTAHTVLDRAFHLIELANPDVLLLGGDYVTFDAKPRILEELYDRLATLTVATRYGVMGNHDLWTQDHKIEATLERAGVRVLVNESVQLPAPWDDVTVVGLDEPRVGSWHPHRAFSGLDEDGYRIVLCHAPQGLRACADHPFDFYLCGHTHGGHIATPWGPVFLPRGKLNRRFHAGLKEHKGVGVFVSRGIGATEFPARAFARPDILILDLVRP